MIMNFTTENTEKEKFNFKNSVNYVVSFNNSKLQRGGK